jgi:hypothetical protein
MNQDVPPDGKHNGRTGNMARTIRLTELDDDVREFLTSALAEGGLVFQLPDGRRCGALVPWTEAMAEEREAARERLREIARRTRERMEADGRTEEELDRILQED